MPDVVSCSSSIILVTQRRDDIPMRRHIGFGLLFAFTVTAAYAGDGCHVIKKLALPKQQLTVVVSNGELEACSLGSYAVRIYSTQDAQPGDDTTFYVAGILHERDGTIEDVFTDNLGDRAPNALIITTRSAGTGSYISAQAYIVGKQDIHFLIAVDGMDGTSNRAKIVSALTQKLTTSDTQ